MHQILIVYSSSEGHTLKIGEFVADLIRDRGHIVDLAEVSTVTGAHFERDYDAAILAASIHAGKHQRSMVRFAREHALWLKSVSSAFISVSLTSATSDAEHQRLADDYVGRFVEEVGWAPDRIWLTAGALPYRRYSMLKRMIMRSIAKREGGDVDVSRDYEYTDWDALKESVLEFLTHVVEPQFAGTGTF